MSPLRGSREVCFLVLFVDAKKKDDGSRPIKDIDLD